MSAASLRRRKGLCGGRTKVIRSDISCAMYFLLCMCVRACARVHVWSYVTVVRVCDVCIRVCVCVVCYECVCRVRMQLCTRVCVCNIVLTQKHDS